ncbi:MAG: hypothetical protein JNJ46_09325 [Myxococcales bacterium]|nr:hypothetical protein [Myxococcales bacterium]
MGFIDDIKKGLPGLKLAIPESWRVQDEQERRAVLIDAEHRVGWHIVHAPWRADLRPEHFADHKRDLERHARYSFEQQYHQIQLQAQPGQAPPQRPPVRTSDPEFHPLIQAEYITVCGQPALFTLRRVAYEPVMEAVVGNILIPVATGILDITAFQHTQQTGYRETNLLNHALQKYPGEGPQKLARRLGQSHFDDPANDAQFPQHPLTCVRAAIRWLLALSKDELDITAPATPLPAPGSEIELPSVGAAIRLPARYALIPDGVLPIPVGVTLLSRVILEGGDEPQMLDVRQLSGITLPAEGRPDKLMELLQRQVQEWQQQGGSQIEVHTEAVELPQDPARVSDGARVALAVQVSLTLGGVRTHTVVRWLCDHDGRVFRIGVATPPFIPIQEAAADADAVLKSFRRLPPKKTGGAWLTSDLRLAPAKRAQQAASSAT